MGSSWPSTAAAVYRHHPLLLAALRAELDRREPLLRPPLHRRASAWFEQQGNLAEAGRHARAAGDLERAGELVWAALPRALDTGSTRPLRELLDGFTCSHLAAQPTLAMAFAWRRLLEGDAAGAELWARTAELDLEKRPATATAAGLQSAAAALRAFTARGVRRMGEAAEAGLSTGAPDGWWQSVCGYLAGIARRLQGEAGRAQDCLEEAGRMAMVHEARVVAAGSLSQLALLAVAEEDWERAASAVRGATTHLEESAISDHPWLAAVQATASLVLAQQGRSAEAHAAIRQARRMLNGAGWAPPWMALEVRILLARADLMQGDLASARTLLLEGARLLSKSPDAGVLGARLQEAGRRADAFQSAGVPGTSSLSRAELRTLRFLPTHLSYREIAEQLHLSQCTVKTQVLAAFRKLDVTSRSEAVQRASTLGLIPR